MRRLVIVGLLALGSFVLLVINPPRSRGQNRPYRESGSTLRSESGSSIQGSFGNARSQPEAGSGIRQQQESGSALSPREQFLRRFSSQSGSSLREPEVGSHFQRQPRRFESGSALRQESGSALRPWQRKTDLTDRQESGSAMIPSAVGRPGRPGETPPPRGPNEPPPGTGDYYAERDYYGQRDYATPQAERFDDATLIAGAVVLLILGAVIGYLLSRGAAAVALPGSGLWSMQAELCCDLAQQMDAFLLALSAGDWERCGDALESLKESTGQRMMLLNNDINRAVVVFVAAATSTMHRKDAGAQLEDLKSSYHVALDVMRRLSRAEPISPDVHRLLDATHEQMQSLARAGSGAA